MYKIFIFTVLIFFLQLSTINCKGNIKMSEQTKNKNELNYELATFGGGCFWCTEAVFKQIDGVIETEVGYAGGDVENPTYEQVCTGKTGHAEVCQIKFDPEKISYNELLEIFFKTHDPTTLNRQGADVGTQYRSVIFYHNETQKNLAIEFIKKLEREGVFSKPIVTQVEPLKNYYRAEEYHQNYFEKNPYSTYCIFVVAPKVEKTKKIFQNKLK
ncbi:MAG: peptide-methionine (S)-S-oxide reductase MsrA [Ignavibacteria bacterium]|nr:peptide-methionine (S)-S-oxide reductase MsrA [Ignavibacteria bacterium]